MDMVYDHVFKMGKPPYRLVGFWAAPSTELQEHNPSAYNSEMSSKPACCHFSCDHCGMGISNHFIIEDSTGERFSVGSSCVSKTDDSKLISSVKKKRNELDRLKRRQKREAIHLEAKAKREAVEAAQRKANGGLTDYELAEKLKAEELAKKRSDAEEKFPRVLRALDKAATGNPTGFAGSIASEIRARAQIPDNGRVVAVIADIYSKFHGGRRNSNAYAASQEEFYNTYIEDNSNGL